MELARDLILSDLRLVVKASGDTSQCHPYVDVFSSLMASSRGIDPALRREFMAGIMIDLAVWAPNQIESSRSLSGASDQSIPLSTHHIWICSPEEPAIPKPEFLKRALNSAAYLRQDYAHYFWMSPVLLGSSDLPRILSDAGFICRSTDELLLSEFPGAIAAYEAFLRDRKFAIACDILRIFALYSCGGLYMDMGINLKIDPLEVPSLRQAKYVLLHWKNMFFQNSLLGMRRHDPISRLYLDQFNSKCEFKNLFSLELLSGETEVWACGGPQITRLLIESLIDHAQPGIGEVAAAVILPANQQCISWQAQQSWYKPDESGKMKYNSCNVLDSAASYFE